MANDRTIENLVQLVSFLGHLEADDPKSIYGAVRINDAITSLCEVMGITREQFNTICFPNANV